MATTTSNKTTVDPTRLEMARTRKAPAVQSRKAAARASASGASKRAATPKVVGKKASSSAASKPQSLASKKRLDIARQRKNERMMADRPKSPKAGSRYRSATGSAAKINIAGRHVPPNLRYKTGYWRPVRQSWMSDNVWTAFKSINRVRNKMMAKGLGEASLGKEIYGKMGPGHAGYGTGELQKWADKMLREGKDPHMVDLTKWFAGAAAAIDYHNGRRDFSELMKQQRGDPDHFMRYVIEKMQQYIPQAKKLSRRDVESIMKNRFYTAQYGPDGRAK